MYSRLYTINKNGSIWKCVYIECILTINLNTLTNHINQMSKMCEWTHRSTCEWVGFRDKNVIVINFNRFRKRIFSISIPSFFCLLTKMILMIVVDPIEKNSFSWLLRWIYYKNHNKRRQKTFQMNIELTI